MTKKTNQPDELREEFAELRRSVRDGLNDDIKRWGIDGVISEIICGEFDGMNVDIPDYRRERIKALIRNREAAARDEGYREALEEMEAGFPLWLEVDLQREQSMGAWNFANYLDLLTTIRYKFLKFLATLQERKEGND